MTVINNKPKTVFYTESSTTNELVAITHCHAFYYSLYFDSIAVNISYYQILYWGCFARRSWRSLYPIITWWSLWTRLTLSTIHSWGAWRSSLSWRACWTSRTTLSSLSWKELSNSRGWDRLRS